MKVEDLTPELRAIMTKSLKSNRWDAINLGPQQSYTNDNMVARWMTEKNKWLMRRPEMTGPNAEDDVRGPVTSGPLPELESDPVHQSIRRTMK